MKPEKNLCHKIYLSHDYYVKILLAFFYQRIIMVTWLGFNEGIFSLA
jgi:hypothetical protein